MAILNGRIVQHLEDPPGSGRAFCSGEPIEEYFDFQKRECGLVFCPACYQAYLRREG